MLTLQQKIKHYISENPLAITLDMAAHFNLAEGEILQALPNEFVRIIPATELDRILTALCQWGTLTTIIEKEGSVFEIKDRFPSGIIARSYYNLNMKSKEGTLCGYLKIDNIATIAFVSLPFRGKESYNIAFIAANGNTVFKVYLGRDKQHKLFPEQVEKFKNFN